MSQYYTIASAWMNILNDTTGIMKLFAQCNQNVKSIPIAMIITKVATYN